MSQEEQTPEYMAMRRQIRLDMLVDLGGNLALALGIWGWLGESAPWHAWLHEPAAFIPLTATGILNLLHLPARLKRLREWQQRR